MFRNRTLYERVVIIAYEIIGVVVGAGLITGIAYACLAG